MWFVPHTNQIYDVFFGCNMSIATPPSLSNNMEVNNPTDFQFCKRMQT
jgi:hypothetical protein